jgi:hypothetical protein
VSKSFGIEDFDGLVIFKKFIPTEFGKYSLSVAMMTCYSEKEQSSYTLHLKIMLTTLYRY